LKEVAAVDHDMVAIFESNDFRSTIDDLGQFAEFEQVLQNE